jgi:hypothetical protein
MSGRILNVVIRAARWMQDHTREMGREVLCR